MTRLVAIFCCLLLVACKSPEQARQSSLAAYAAGDVQGAIMLLDSLPADDYVAGALRARYHISAAYHGGYEAEFGRAFDSLREIRTPTENSTETGSYLTFLRFTALGNAGRTEQAGQLWAPYCGTLSDSQDYLDCIRMEWAKMSVALEDSRGEKLDQDLFAAAKSAYLKVYGWDPSVFQNPAEHRAFLERVDRAIKEGRMPND
jgi:hypothetical protein